MTFRADLHCHSHFSDGSDSPEEIIRRAIDVGLSGLSITDHDTIEAYPQATSFAKELQFPLLPGIEFSAAFHRDPVHILGYAFSLKSESLRQLCQRHIERRLDRNRKILMKLNALGISVKEEELERVSEKGRTKGRPHIALLLIEKRVVKSISEAFDTFLGEGKLAYDPGEPISVEETIKVVHSAKGKAIIAHPHLIKRSSTLKALLEMPFDGLEGRYPRLTAQQQKKWAELAKSKGWILTGGSDYHGTIKPHNILGLGWVEEKTFNSLYAHYVEIS